MKRKIWFWLSFVVAIILAVYFSVRIIMNAMGYNGATIVRQISIDADTHDMDLGQIGIGAGVAGGTPSRDIDTGVILARVSAIPGIKQAAVRKMPNGNLRIKVTTYHAVALWTDGLAYYPLSADGTIVQSPMTERTDDAVVFMGAVPNDISEITAAAHNIGEYLDYMEWIENRRWDIHTTNGIRVMLPEKNPAAAIATLIALNQNHKILSKKIGSIDLRDDARILVK